MALIHRSPASNKGDHGALGILGGASGTVGAAFLAARAALFSGAGRVYVVRPNLSDGYVLDPVSPEVMVIDAGQAKVRPINVWLAGPGLGMSDAAHQLLSDVLGKPAPLVIDADGLNLIAEDPALGRQCARRSAPTVITPHPGEASRLLECSADQVQASRDQAAQGLAKRFNAIAVLKGAGTVICDAAGNTQINTTGNAALATGGTGDVLAGFMAALIAQGLEPLTAARESVRIHGLAAEQLTDQIGGVLGITASELIPVIRKLLNSSERF
jgi:ADP-dependent NAD(P)H-hydrate dehydratase / NAD(P)H-hydrate epimerase